MREKREARWVDGGRVLGREQVVGVPSGGEGEERYGRLAMGVGAGWLIAAVLLFVVFELLQLSLLVHVSLFAWGEASGWSVVVIGNIVMRVTHALRMEAHYKWQAQSNAIGCTSHLCRALTALQQ